MGQSSHLKAIKKVGENVLYDEQRCAHILIYKGGYYGPAFNDRPRDWARETNQRTCAVNAQLRAGGPAAEQLADLRALGQLLSAWRRQNSLSRTELARRSRLPPTEVAWLEWGLLTAVEVESRLPQVIAALGKHPNLLGHAYHAIFTRKWEPLTH